MRRRILWLTLRRRISWLRSFLRAPGTWRFEDYFVEINESQSYNPDERYASGIFAWFALSGRGPTPEAARSSLRESFDAFVAAGGERIRPGTIVRFTLQTVVMTEHDEMLERDRNRHLGVARADAVRTFRRVADGDPARELDPWEREMLDALLSADFPGAEDLRVQALRIRAETEGRPDGALTLAYDEPDDTAPIATIDAVPVEAACHINGMHYSIMLFTYGGLSTMEAFAMPYGDPTMMPAVEHFDIIVKTAEIVANSGGVHRGRIARPGILYASL